MKKSLVFLSLALICSYAFGVDYVIWKDGSCNNRTKSAVMIACHFLALLGFAVTVNFNEFRNGRFYWFISSNRFGKFNGNW